MWVTPSSPLRPSLGGSPVVCGGLQPPTTQGELWGTGPLTLMQDTPAGHPAPEAPGAGQASAGTASWPRASLCPVLLPPLPTVQEPGSFHSLAFPVTCRHHRCPAHPSPKGRRNKHGKISTHKAPVSGISETRRWDYLP